MIFELVDWRYIYCDDCLNDIQSTDSLLSRLATVKIVKIKMKTNIRFFMETNDFKLF